MTLTLIWSPSAQSDVIGYHVYYGLASRQYTRMLDAGDAATAVLPDLSPGTTYFLAVTAYNGLGIESLPSNEISVSTAGAATGLYTGLFSEPSGPQPGTAGSFKLLLRASGTFSAMLQIGAKRFGFSGKLDSEARALAALRRAGATPLTVQVEVGSGSGAGVVTGEVTDGSWIATAVGYLAPFSSRSWHSPVAGSYTLILPGQDGAPGSTAGDGYAAVRATSGGVVSVAGVLADGTRFTQAAALSSAGFWPMFVPNSAGQGLLTGWLGFQSGSSSSPDGTLTWIKPQASTSIYESAGLTNITQTIGSSYLLSKSATGLPWESTPFEAVFSGGDLATGFTNSCVMLNPSHAVSQGISGFTMNFSRTTGLFRGKVVDPATGQQLNFGGAVLQNVGSGFGYVLLPNRSGRIVLNP